MRSDPVDQFLIESSDVKRSFSNYFLEALRLDFLEDLGMAWSKIGMNSFDTVPGHFKIAPELSINNRSRFEDLLKEIYDLEQQALTSFRTLIKEAQVRLAAD